jgi:hypothetical protein
LAGAASSSLDTFHSGPYKGVLTSTDVVVVNLFALTFPLPSQETSWHMLMIGPKEHSLVILTLLGKRLTMQQWMSLPAAHLGESGQPIVWPMHVGEYTCPSLAQKTLTRQFHLMDITFWARNAADKYCQFPFHAPMVALLAANAFTLILSNQKNGMRDAVLHPNHMDDALCPVKALAHHFASARAASNGRKKALICQYGPSQHMVARHLSQVLKRAAIRTSIWLEGFALNCIGTNVLEA